MARDSLSWYWRKLRCGVLTAYSSPICRMSSSGASKQTQQQQQQNMKNNVTVLVDACSLLSRDLRRQTQTNTFESVDTLSDNVAQSLAAIGECLMLLHHDRQLRQNYTAARRYPSLLPKLMTRCLLLVPCGYECGVWTSHLITLTFPARMGCRRTRGHRLVS